MGQSNVEAELEWEKAAPSVSFVPLLEAQPRYGDARPVTRLDPVTTRREI